MVNQSNQPPRPTKRTHRPRYRRVLALAVVSEEALSNRATAKQFRDWIVRKALGYGRQERKRQVDKIRSKSSGAKIFNRTKSAIPTLSRS